MRARATIWSRYNLREVDMSPIEPTSTRPPVVSDQQLVLIVYLLYFAAYIFGITALIGVIIAHTKWPDTGPPLRSHYQFQIRTFWIGLLYLVVGAGSSLRGFPGNRSRRVDLVVHLVAGAQRQGLAGVE